MMGTKVALFVELCKQNVAKTIFSELNLGVVPDFIFCLCFLEWHLREVIQ